MTRRHILVRSRASRTLLTAAHALSRTEEALRLRGKLRKEFMHLEFSSHAIQKLLDDFHFMSALDIGSGQGIHSKKLLEHGKKVTSLDYGDSVYFRNRDTRIDAIIADFNSYNFQKKFDCVWCSHVLEHQLDVNQFLTKIFDLLDDTGVLAITVPPIKTTVVGGHVSLWSMGLLLYRLVLAGFDCSNAIGLKYGYNISVIVVKSQKTDVSKIQYDAGDIRLLRKYLPDCLSYQKTSLDDHFDGDIQELNWF